MPYSSPFITRHRSSLIIARHSSSLSTHHHSSPIITRHHLSVVTHHHPSSLIYPWYTGLVVIRRHSECRTGRHSSSLITHHARLVTARHLPFTWCTRPSRTVQYRTVVLRYSTGLWGVIVLKAFHSHSRLQTQRSPRTIPAAAAAASGGGGRILFDLQGVCQGRGGGPTTGHAAEQVSSSPGKHHFQPITSER